MNLKHITVEQIEELQGSHAVVIISDDKIKLVELPSYGNVEITCHENKVKQVKEERSARY